MVVREHPGLLSPHLGTDAANYQYIDKPLDAAAASPAIDPALDNSLLPLVQAAFDGSSATCSEGVEWWVDAPSPSGPESGWIRVRSALSNPPLQGWKLHVSATILSAREVLRRVLPVLSKEGVSFKVASSISALHNLNHGAGGASQIGKFVTIYPNDDAQAVRLARSLDEATAGLEGPAIPSDRPLRPGSLVHYRYGGFDGRYTQTPLGEIIPAINNLEGMLVPDRRRAVYSAPDWASDPFLEGNTDEISSPKRWIGGSYLLLSTLYSAPRGTIYMALDFQNSRSCVMKRASRGAVCSLDGYDAQERLRNEARIMARLAPDPRFPAFYDLIEQDGDLYLVMEDVAGITLAQHATQLVLLGKGLAAGQITGWGRELASILHALHSNGLIYRDIKPTNVMLTPDNRLRLIDLELCYEPKSGSQLQAPGIGTRGYMSPQQTAGGRPDITDDIYSLGALLYFLASGAEPSTSPQACDLFCRPIEWINPRCDPALAQVIQRCLAADQAGRYQSMESLERALEEIEPAVMIEQNEETCAAQVAAHPIGDSAETNEHYRQLARKLGDTICREAKVYPDGRGVTWVTRHPSANHIEARDINLGSSGTILALSELVSELGVATHRETLAAAARYLSATTHMAPDPLPGLYVGEAGVGLALLRAGQALGDRRLLDAAIEKGRLVSSAPHASPDLFNGTAGRLRFHLWLWGETQDREQLGFAVEAGEYLLACGQVPSHGEFMWVIPAGYDGLSGNAYLGYAHGAAGIGDALLYLYEATSDERFLEAAQSAGRWLARQSVPTLEDGTGLAWPTIPGSAPAMPFWCHGATGIGRFFLHLAQMHAFPGAGQILIQAARSVSLGARWAGPTQCHGLSGNIEFLLDMFQFTGDDAYLADAHQLARLLEAFSRERDGLLVWSSDSPEVVTPDYMIGYSGVAVCLLRLGAPERLTPLFGALILH
jgi:tRNA A-37 threonylcarbamoyl transferase component Bud32